MMIDLGGGTLPHPRADIVIDLTRPKNSPAQDATATPWLSNRHPAAPDKDGTGAWALLDGCADEVYSSHFMEHIPKGQPLINVMNEAHRVLKPGGTYTMILPLVGYTEPFTGAPMSNQIGWQPWADPTHVSFWWLPEAFMYFTAGPFRPHADYGIQEWGPLGSYVDESEATRLLDMHRHTPTPLGSPSYWSVRSQWEGVCRLVKP